MQIDWLLGQAPVVPVLVIDDVAFAQPIAEALVSGGLTVLEVTLRTPNALSVISAMSKVPGAIVGAGTVLDKGQVNQAVKAGAQFLVSPGLTTSIVQASAKAEVPLLPGVATAGDIMRGLDQGLTHFKFFPAEAAGGVRALKALAAPFFGSRFCPTGGISEATAPDYLALPSVVCVGGSWIVPPGRPDFDVVFERACAAARLRTFEVAERVAG